MVTLSQQDIQRNMRAVAHGIAQQTLEGLEVTPATVSDLHRAARGEVGADEIIRKILGRFQDVPILRR
jgi:hypothetical protein